MVTSAYATRLVSMDMKPGMQDFCGDLSGFYLYFRSHGHGTRKARLSQRPVRFRVNELFFFYVKLLHQISLLLAVILDCNHYIKV